MDESKLERIFSEFIRLRDSDGNGNCICITCPAFGNYKIFECGHGVSRKYLAVKYSEENNNAQCHKCNCLKGGMEKRYSVAVDRKFGPGTWDGLKSKARGVLRTRDLDVPGLIRHYTKLVKDLKKEKGLK